MVITKSILSRHYDVNVSIPGVNIGMCYRPSNTYSTKQWLFLLKVWWWWKWWWCKNFKMQSLQKKNYLSKSLFNEQQESCKNAKNENIEDIVWIYPANHISWYLWTGQAGQGRQNYFLFRQKMTTLRTFYFHLSLSNAQWVKNLLYFFHLMAQNLKLTRNRGVRVGRTFIYLEETVFEYEKTQCEDLNWNWKISPASKSGKQFLFPSHESSAAFDL